MDARERYLWDLNGYLVVKGVLTDAEIAAANEVIDRYSEQIKLDAVGVRSRDSETLQGTGRPTLSGFLEMERPYCDPYRALLAHPALVYRLNVMMGKGFRLDHGPLLIGGAKGTEGLTMHGSGEPHRPMVAYHHQNGETYVGGVTVTWYLADANAGDGGFACVPGSHKSGYAMPDGVRTADADLGVIVQPEMRAGDVLFFMDGALTHGTLPWTSDRPRRSVLYKYSARAAVRGGPALNVIAPERYWGEEMVEGMTEQQLAVMYGPASGHQCVVPSLTVDDEGAVRTISDTARRMM